MKKLELKIRWSIIDLIMYKKPINLGLPVGVLGFCKNNEITKIYASPLTSITSSVPEPSDYPRIDLNKQILT